MIQERTSVNSSRVLEPRAGAPAVATGVVCGVLCSAVPATTRNRARDAGELPRSALCGPPGGGARPADQHLPWLQLHRSNESFLKNKGKKKKKPRPNLTFLKPGCLKVSDPGPSEVAL